MLDQQSVSSSASIPTSQSAADLLAEINEEILKQLEIDVGMSRRKLFSAGIKGAMAISSLSVVAAACRTTSAGTSGAYASPLAGSSFLQDVAAAEAATPLPAMTDPNFKAAATARGGAVFKTIGKWLKLDPYAMFAELQAQDPKTMPIFRPVIGPVIIMRHPHVIDALSRTHEFTVDMYAPAMRISTEGSFPQNQGKPDYYMLGTDNDNFYRPDGIIMRKAVTKEDQPLLKTMLRGFCNNWTKEITANGARSADLVKTYCRYIPVSIVHHYLGVPSFEAGVQTPFADGTKGGDEFVVDAELAKRFTFQRIGNGTVKATIPTANDVYLSVKAAFRNIFNNLGKDPAVIEEGLIATEKLSAYIHKVLMHYKPLVRKGDASVPDTMLTRLLKMQLQLENKKNAADMATAMDLSPEELLERVSDSRIRENVFGTAVGAVVNPEEGAARVIDSMLKLREGFYTSVAAGSTYDDAVQAAKADNYDVLNRFMLEALRLQPQGEVLLRACVQDAVVAGVNITKGTVVFVAHGAAMRDGGTIKNPMGFDINRDMMLSNYKGDSERKGEMPQSQLYLQHGFGRHKCLGRYASEITMTETLRAVLLLGDVKRSSELVMDANNLYAESLTVTF